MNFDKLEKTRESRCKSIDVKYHAHEIELAMNCYYWTGDMFHVEEAVSHFENLAAEMAKLKHVTREEK